MSRNRDLDIEQGDWDTMRADAVIIRYGVFVMEQDVPEDMELDLMDPLALHWLVRDAGGEAIATARLTPDHHVGRMAVLPDFRNQGVGGALMRSIQQHALDSGLPALLLNAQVHALAFYERHDFVASGPVFDDAGIPHRAMRWQPAAGPGQETGPGHGAGQGISEHTGDGDGHNGNGNGDGEADHG